MRFVFIILIVFGCGKSDEPAETPPTVVNPEPTPPPKVPVGVAQCETDFFKTHVSECCDKFEEQGIDDARCNKLFNG